MIAICKYRGLICYYNFRTTNSHGKPLKRFYDQLRSILAHPQGQLVLQSSFNFLSDKFLIQIIETILQNLSQFKNDDNSKFQQNLLHLLTTKFDEKYWRHRFTKTRQTSYEYDHISGVKNLGILDYFNLLTHHENIISEQSNFLEITIEKDLENDDTNFTVQQRGNYYFIGLIESDDNPCMRHWRKYGNWRRFDLALYSVSRDNLAPSLSNQHLCTLDIWNVNTEPENDSEDEAEMTPEVYSHARSEVYHLAEPFLLKVTDNEIQAAFIPQLPLQFATVKFTDEIDEFPRIDDSGNFRNAKSRIIPVITKSGALLKFQLVKISFDSEVKMEVIWRCLLDRRGKTDVLNNSLRVNLTHVAFCTRVKSFNSRITQACVCRIPLSNPKLEMVPFFNFSRNNRAWNFQSYIVRYYRIGHKLANWNFWNSNFVLFDIVNSNVYFRQHFACSICPPFTDMPKEPSGYKAQYVPKIYKVNFDAKAFETVDNPPIFYRRKNRVYL